jgi:Rad3-related DNA helicase
MRPLSILDYVPVGYTLRDNQPEILKTIEESWNRYDIFVLVSDVGTGKSVILQTIAEWQASKKRKVATITPKIMLQEQYERDFRGVPILKGSGRYSCKDQKEMPCKDVKDVCGFYCGKCKYVEAKEAAMESNNSVYNLQSYLLAGDTRQVVLMDEAHTLFGTLSDMYTCSVWKHKYGYPDDIMEYMDILLWIERTRGTIKQEIIDATGDLDDLQKSGASLKSKKYRTAIKGLNSLEDMDERLLNIYNGIQAQDKNFFIEHSMEYYRGTKRPLLRVRPMTLSGLPLSVFGSKTQKLVLATATMNDLDLDKLGLSGKRCKRLEFDSPLLASDRPIQLEFVGNMSYKYQEKNLPKLAEKIEELRTRHIDTKGIVHCTYAMAVKLQDLKGTDHFMWHDKNDKDERLEEFRKSPPGTVLIASGMSMGVDLAGPEFGWQAVAKIMYPSQADALIKEWYDKQPEWITWCTAKDLIQACGRINRYKGDQAITYILDSCFGNPKLMQYGIYQAADKQNFWPKYFKDRIRW